MIGGHLDVELLMKMMRILNIANIGIHFTIGELYFTQYNGHWVQAATKTEPSHTLASIVNIFKLLNFDFRKIQRDKRGRCMP